MAPITSRDFDLRARARTWSLSSASRAIPAVTGDARDGARGIEGEKKTGDGVKVMRQIRGRCGTEGVGCWRGSGESVTTYTG